VLELDPLFQAPKTAAILRLDTTGAYREVFRSAIKPWGKWLRYQYATFDFSAVKEPGIYVINYAGDQTGPYPIAPHLYRKGLCPPPPDTYPPVHMAHMKVRE